MKRRRIHFELLTLVNHMIFLSQKMFKKKHLSVEINFTTLCVISPLLLDENNLCETEFSPNYDLKC